VHISSLVLDAKSGISASAVVIPMSSAYRPIAVTVGALALYTIGFVAAVGAVRGRLAATAVGARRWRLAHSAAYVGWALAVAHGLFAGTDSTTRPVILLNIACVSVVMAALSRRLWSQDAYDESALAGSRRTVSELSSRGAP
jgi:sulfoxide reductase heme-binding subunit YedZ